MITKLGLLRRLPIVVYCGESIFEYEYLRKYEAKIEKVYSLVLVVPKMSYWV